MKKQKEVKKGSFMGNVLMLIGSHLLIKILGFIYRLVITNVEGFGDVGVGYYDAGYKIYSLLLTLSSTGIPSVVSKLVAERLAVDDKAGAQRIFKISLAFFTGLGFLLTLGLYYGADIIANNVLNVPGTVYVMKVLAPAIVFVAISAVLRGYYSGQQNMKPIGISQTLEQFLNCVLSITFVYACIGKDTYVMAAAGNLSTTLSIILAFVYMVLYYRSHQIIPEEGQVSSENNKSNGELLKTILAISIPITIGSLVSVISSVIDTATVSNCIQVAYQNMGMTKEALENLAMSKTGILSKIETLVNFPIAINAAFSTALVPAIAESIAKKDRLTAQKRMTFSIFASILIILPCAVGFSVLASAILKMFYPAASDGAVILQLSTIPMIFIALSNTINGGLYGLNLSKVPAISLIIGVIVKTFLNIILISNPDINVIGAIIGSIACQSIAFTICYMALKRKLKIKMDKKNQLVKPVIATIIMGIAVYVAYYLFSKIMGNTMSTLIAILVGVVVYLVSLLLFRALSKEDILMIPHGNKVYQLLVRLRLYKDD